MSDVPHYPGSVAISNDERRNAALSLAEICAGDPRRLAYYLCELGLAEHQGDGTFTSLPDEDRWYSRRETSTGPTFCLIGESVDDCR